MRTTEGYEDFRGIRRDAHRSRLPDGSFQEDVNGDRFEDGTWRRRRGIRRLDVASQSAGIETLIGVELPGGDYGLLLIAGGVAVGETNRSQLVQHVDGHGVTSAGSGARGA